MAEKNEQDFVDEMKDAILEQAQEISQKVSISASKFIDRKEWVNPEHQEEFNLFLTTKMSKVIAERISSRLNSILGLDLQL